MRCTKRLLHAKYYITASKLVGILKSCLSMLATIRAPHKLGQTFLYDQAWPGCTSSRLDRLL